MVVREELALADSYSNAKAKSGMRALVGGGEVWRDRRHCR